jgi:hypothetical protein
MDKGLVYIKLILCFFFGGRNNLWVNVQHEMNLENEARLRNSNTVSFMYTVLYFACI